VSVVPFSRGSNISVLAAMRVDGVSAWKAFDGAVNAALFIEFVEQQLAPTLRPGDVLVLDNVRFHHVEPVRRAVEARGAKLCFIPAYHPELNAAEELFSFLKGSLRRRKERTIVGLMSAIQEVFEGVGFKRISSFINHALKLGAQPS
jgi:transposase